MKDIAEWFVYILLYICFPGIIRIYNKSIIKTAWVYFEKMQAPCLSCQQDVDISTQHKLLNDSVKQSNVFLNHLLNTSCTVKKHLLRLFGACWRICWNPKRGSCHSQTFVISENPRISSLKRWLVVSKKNGTWVPWNLSTVERSHRDQSD